MSPDVVRFEDFELDRSAYQLRRAGQVVRLERLPMELLLLLVERRGQLVTRREILSAVWGNEVVRDVDHSINTAVGKIRYALKDDPDNPRLLQTIPGKGYRFSAAIAGPEVAPLAAESAPRTDLRAAAPFTAKRRHWPLWLALAAAIVLAAILIRPYLRQSKAPETPKAMLVVLPFENLSGNAAEDYFADGMTEELITQLGSLDPGHLGVIARTSAMQFKGSHKDVAQIGRELGVKYLLEGSVRRSNDRVRVTAQLVSTYDQTHLWADSFDSNTSDVLKLESDVARAISRNIQLALPEYVSARLTRTRSISPQAHEAYLEGLQSWNLRTKQAFENALVDFDRAIAIDPNYALAYAGIARTYSLATVVGLGTPTETMPKARDAATRALALDDSVASAHSTLAFVRAHFDFDWNAAEREFRRGIELNPSDAYAHLFYSNSFLSPRGRHDEAIAEMKTAIELDPLSAPVDSFLARTYLWARRYQDALAHLQKSVQRFPNFALDHERLAHLYTYIGNFDDAITEETKARLLSGDDPREALRQEDALRKALAARGPRGYWERVLDASRTSANVPEAYATSYGVAVLYARLGENNKALGSLERAYAERQLAMTEIAVEPAFDTLRSEARFQRLMHLVGVAP